MTPPPPDNAATASRIRECVSVLRHAMEVMSQAGDSATALDHGLRLTAQQAYELAWLADSLAPRPAALPETPPVHLPA